MPTYKPDALRPALAGGLIGALLSVVPPLCCLNLCCCMDYVIGGIVAGALYAGRAAAIGWYPGTAEGAAPGGLAGVISGAIHGLLTAFGSGLWFLFARESWGAAGRASTDIDWDWPLGRDDTFFEWLGGWPSWQLASGQVATSIILGALAGAVGGMIGVMLFRRPAPANTVYDV